MDQKRKLTEKSMMYMSCTDDYYCCGKRQFKIADGKGSLPGGKEGIRKGKKMFGAVNSVLSAANLELISGLRFFFKANPKLSV